MDLKKLKYLRKIMILCCGVLSFSASAHVGYLVIDCKDGSKTSMALADEPVMTCENNVLCASSSNIEIEIPFKDLLNFYFSENDVSNVKSLETDSSSHQIYDDQITFQNLKPGELIDMYNISGMLMRHVSADSEGNAIIDMAGLSSGVYIVRTANLSFKVNKK